MSLKKPLISIITVAYNQERFIGQCIESVINQTLTDWEMIIVDDFSNDNTVNIVKQYAIKNDSIKPIFHNKNWGMGKITDSYNQALKITQGKYIFILEGDDYWPFDKLEKQLSLYDKKSVLSYGNCLIVNQSSFPINLYVNANFTNPTYYAPTILFNKTALIKIGGFIKSRNYPFWDIPTIVKLQLTGRFQYHNEILGVYRKHPNSNWLHYSYKQSKYKNINIFRKINSWATFNFPLIYLPRIIAKYSLYLVKKYILKECKPTLNIM